MKNIYVLRLPSKALDVLRGGGDVVVVHQNDIRGVVTELHDLIPFPRPATEAGIAEAWEREFHGKEDD